MRSSRCTRCCGAFVVLRVVVVSTLLLSAFLIQFTFSTALPLNAIYYLAAFAYSISIAAILSLDRIPAEANAAIQLLGDLFVITGLVYISGGPDSSFTFLYLGTVAAGRDPARPPGRPRRRRGSRPSSTPCSSTSCTSARSSPSRTTERTPHLWTPAGARRATSRSTSARSSRRRSSCRTRRTSCARPARTSNAARPRSRASRRSTRSVLALDVLRRPHDGPRRARHVREPRRAGAPRRALRGPRRPARPSARARRRGRLEADRRRGLGDPPLRDDPAHQGPGRVLRRLVVGPARRLGLHGRAHPDLPEPHRVKRLEGEVRLKDKLAAVGELAAGIAHEIRNPLASISGSVQALQGSVPPGLARAPPHEDRRRRVAPPVAPSSRTSSATSARRSAPLEPVDAPAALGDVLTLLAHSRRGLAAPRDRREDGARTRSCSTADPGQLRQIFWNVARNALAAMPGGGTLTVTATLEGAAWKVSFADEGHGMTARGARAASSRRSPTAFPGGTGPRPRDRAPDRRGARRRHRSRHRAGPGNDRRHLAAPRTPRRARDPTETALAAAEVP